MWGYEEPDFDYHCGYCGAGHYNEVGFGKIFCDHCGRHISGQSPEAQPKYEPMPDEDVLLDADFILFDHYAAFRYLKDKGILNKFLK